MTDECDLSYCNNEGDHDLTKYIRVCGTHWFLIMNGIKKISHAEGEKLQEIEKQRKEATEEK